MLKRIIKWIVIAELSWLVLANLFLNTPVGPWATSIKPEKFTLQWDSGWSLYPARVQVNNATMTIHSWTTDTVLQTDRAQARFHLLPLFSKRLVIDHLVVGKTSIDIQRDVPEGERPAPSKPYPGMIIDITNATVDSVEKFRFNHIRLTAGTVDARGSASLQIRGDKVISDVDASWDNARMDLEGQEFGGQFSASFSGGTSAFNPRVDKGLDILEKISGNFSMDGEVGTLEPLQLLFPEVEWIEHINGQGTVAIDASMVNGQFQPGTDINIDAHALKLDFLGFNATGSGLVAGGVSSQGENPDGRLDIKFSEFEIAHHGQQVPIVSGNGLSLLVQAPNLGVIRNTSELRVRLDIPDSNFPNVSTLGEFLPSESGASIQSGSAQLSSVIEVQGSDRLASGSIAINGKDIRGKFGKTGYRTDLTLQTRFSDQDLSSFKVGLSNLEVALKNTRLDIEGKDFSGTFGAGFTGRIATMDLRQERGLELAEKLSGQFELHGDVGTLSPLGLLFPGVEWIERIDGHGKVAILAEIEQGRLHKGTKVDIDAHDLLLDFLGFTATGSAKVTGDIGNRAADRDGRLEIVFKNYNLARQGQASPLVTGEGMSLKAQAPDLGLADNVSGLRVVLNIPESSFPDVSIFSDYLPPTLGARIDSGSARLSAAIEVAGPDQLAVGSLRVVGEDIAGKFRTTGFQSDFLFEAQMHDEDLGNFEVNLSGTRLKLFNGIFDSELVDVEEQWWMSIDFPRGTVNMRQPIAVNADVDLRMKDTRAIIALFADIKHWVSKFDGILTVNDIAGTANIEFTDQELRVRNLELTGDRLKMLAEVFASAEQHDAVVWGKLGPFSMGFERIGEETDWKLINGRKWYEETRHSKWQDQ